MKDNLTHKQIAEITLLHFKLILEKLKYTNLKRFDLVQKIFYISDERLEPCEISIKAIDRFFHIYGLSCKLENYSNYTPINGQMIHCYTWKLSRIKNNDDLPF